MRHVGEAFGQYFRMRIAVWSKAKKAERKTTHELYPTNHNSSLEHAIYGTYCLLLAFLNLKKICHLSNLRSIKLISSPSPLSLSLSSFFLCCGFVWATMAFPNITHKKTYVTVNVGPSSHKISTESFHFGMIM